jgi:hypothetical protein
MGLLNDFDKLHITSKSTALTILGQIPFFFISIYLFSHDLINLIGENPFCDMDFIFVLALCFCLSLTWYAMNLVLTSFAFNLGDCIEDDTSTIDDVFKVSVIYSIAYLSIAIFVNYKLQINFYYFLILAYGFLVIRMIYICVLWYFIYRAKQKNK